MKALVIFIILVSFMYKISGQENKCDFKKDLNELMKLGGTYLKDFQMHSDEKNVEFRYTLVLARNTKYLFSLKANGNITFDLSYANPEIPIKTIKNEDILKPAYFEYLTKESGVYHFIIYCENKNTCAIVLLSYLGEIQSQPVDTSKVYDVVDEQASFQNGDINTFRNYVSKNFQMAHKNKDFKGKIFIQFIVNSTGSIETVKIVRGCGNKELDNEGLRVIRNSPKWKPAKINGKKVKQQFVIPILVN